MSNNKVAAKYRLYFLFWKSLTHWNLFLFDLKFELFRLAESFTSTTTRIMCDSSSGVIGTEILEKNLLMQSKWLFHYLQRGTTVSPSLQSVSHCWFLTHACLHLYLHLWYIHVCVGQVVLILCVRVYFLF